MIATHHPCMVTLLKTRMVSHGNLMNDFGFTDMIEILAEGQSGGMAVLWDTNLVNVNNFVKRNNKIHVLIEVSPIRNPWHFYSIYANTNITSKNLMWNNITSIFDSYKGYRPLGGEILMML